MEILSGLNQQREYIFTIFAMPVEALGWIGSNQLLIQDDDDRAAPNGRVRLRLGNYAASLLPEIGLSHVISQMLSTRPINSYKIEEVIS